MLHAKKDPGLLVRNKVIVTEGKKKTHKQKEKKNTRVIKSQMHN